MKTFIYICTFIILFLTYRLFFTYSFLPDFLFAQNFKFKGGVGIIYFNDYSIFINNYKLNEIEDKIINYSKKEITKIKKDFKNLKNKNNKTTSEEWELEKFKFKLYTLKDIIKKRQGIFSFKRGDKNFDSKYNFEYYCFLVFKGGNLATIFIYDVRSEKIVDCIFE